MEDPRCAPAVPAPAVPAPAVPAPAVPAPAVAGLRDVVVSLRDVVVLLGRFPALAGVSIEVMRGEVVLLRGPNGAGKTTLLRLCAGLLPMARGAATVAGIDLATQRSAVRRRVGLLGHANGLYDDLTVADNVRFWGSTVGATSTELDGALARMGLAGGLADVPASRLSAGQRRRCALASLIVRRPLVWLLDEPHAGLDAAGRDELDALVGEAVAAGATVLLSSHELDRAEALAHRVITIGGGTVLSDERVASDDRNAS